LAKADKYLESLKRQLTQWRATGYSGVRTFILLALTALSCLTLSAQEEAVEGGPLLQVSIFFGGGSYYIYPEEQQRLEAFLASVPGLDNYGVEIQGHTDDIGDRAYNLRLSAARAEMVRRRLVALEIAEAAIEVLPLGEDDPSYDNATWEGKLSNRRVDVILRPIL